MINHFQGSKKKRSWFFSPVVFVLLLLLMVVLLKSVWALYGKSQLVGTERGRAYEEWHELDLRRQGLEAKVASLQTDRGIEAELREKFAIVKPGEKVVSIVEDEAALEVTPQTPTWWEKFKGGISLVVGRLLPKQ